MIDINVARDRARRVARIKGLIEEGNYLISEGALTHDQELCKQGQIKLIEAHGLREEFWAMYPNALISYNCAFMAKEVKFS